MTRKKLALNPTTIRHLATADLKQAIGGAAAVVGTDVTCLQHTTCVRK